MISELHFKNPKGEEIKGNLTGSLVKDIYFINDNDILTSAEIMDWVQMDFGAPVRLSEITMLPKNDGNGIYPDNLYELFYMTLNGWVSCGTKVAEGNYIEFKNVPTNALYWLRNKTIGKEERIFTCQKNKIRFW